MTVTISVAFTDVLSVLLKAPTTAQMDALTATSLISFFPNLHQSSECLLTRNFDSTLLGTRVSHRGLECYTTNSHWSSPCGDYCPAAIRKTVEDPGVLLVHWDVRLRPMDYEGLVRKNSLDRDEKAEYVINLLDNKYYRFSISPTCYNPNCLNSVQSIPVAS